MIAALHALAALRAAGTPTPEVVLQCVPSEEDGGLGAFAALERDCRFDGCLIPEPTGFAVVCAQAGALTFRGTVHGRGAHAAMRLEGRSAIDRYIAVHAALAAHERRINADVEHPAMRDARAAVSGVGRPGRGGRVVELGTRPARVRGARSGCASGRSRPPRARRSRPRCASGRRGPAAWRSPGPAARSRSGETDPAHPWVARVREAVRAERGGDAPIAGVPWGADMRLYAARGIPTVMVGTSGIELAHAVDERVRIDEVAAVARIIAGVVAAA